MNDSFVILDEAQNATAEQMKMFLTRLGFHSKVARGPDGYIYPWGNTFDGSLANYCDINCRTDSKDNRFDDGYIDTAPVGGYPGGASVYDVLGIAGNVYEWVADWYGPYRPGNQINPAGPDSGLEKIIRGGAWGDDPVHVRASILSHLKADNWLDFIGFRCCPLVACGRNRIRSGLLPDRCQMQFEKLCNIVQ